MDEIDVSKFKATCLAELERVRRTGRLAATAQVFDFTLVTADADLIRLKLIRTMSGRS